MPSNDQYPEVQPDPIQPLNELLHWLGTAALHCLLGYLLGALLARQMRSRHLHWSWAAIAFALVIELRQFLAGGASVLAIATLLATLRGRRWHRQDLDTGADLGRIATARTTPFDVLRPSLGLCAARVRRLLRRDEARPTGSEQLQLGCDERGGAVAVPFGASGSGQHTLVLGATGSGKTVTQTWMALRSIEHGMGAIVIDPKGDGAMRKQLERAADLAGRRFVQWTPSGPSIYNPYARGSETEIADKVLAGERFTEPHYLRQAQRYLGHTVRGLRSSGADVSLARIVACLDPRELEQLARTLPEQEGAPIHCYLDSLTTRQQSDLAGVRDRLATLVESDVGPWLDPRAGGSLRFDLLDAVRARDIVYFSLESDRRPLLAAMLGAAIVQDLQTVVAELQGSPSATIVVIDEFSAVAAEQVVRLFGRARSAGISLVLGTQELSDLRLPGAEQLLERVMGNLSVLIAHRQVVPSSAELISEVAGTHGAWKVSRHSDGRSTRMRTREAVLEAERVMNLGRGWAAVIVPGAAAKVRIARVFSPQHER